jgi:CHASE2 domain-containing sensor protein/signal transduction histidine kinase
LSRPRAIAGPPGRAARRRVIAEWTLVALAATALVVFLSLSRVTDRADNVVFDTLSTLGVRAPEPQIVIVAIDNRSLAELGRWPWPRARHEALLQKLAEAKPRAIAYDVLLVEPDPDPAVDAALAKAIAGARPVFLPMTFDVPGRNGAPYDLLTPVEPLRSAAAGLGQVNVEFDSDGVIRRAYLLERDGDQTWPHLMALMRDAWLGRSALPAPSPRPAPSGEGLLREHPLLISFAGPPGHFRTISFVDVLRGDTPQAFLRDKLVLIGATGDGLGDRYATPLSNHTEIMSGVELQANLLDTLLTGRALTPAGPIGLAAFSLAPLWLALAGFLMFRPRLNLILWAALSAATVAASALLYLQGRVWAPPTAALAGLLLVYPLWSWRRLEATSAYMFQELQAFSQEPDLLSALSRPRGPPTDVIDRQVVLMHSAIERARDLRRLVLDALHGLPDATLVTDLAGRVLIANREADALFAAGAAEDLTGRPLAELVAHAAPEAPPEATDLSHAPDAELELTGRDGRAFDLRRTALTDQAGAPIGWIVRFTDISALKAAGRQRERILELLTHDMRSPQVSILTLLGSPGFQAPAALIDRIAGYARRTLALADNFVNLARAEGDQYALEPLDLGDVLVEAADDLWPQSSARNIEVTATGIEGEYVVEADRSLLTRALINLIDNAIKFSPDGGRIACALTPAVSEGRPAVVCTISDQGPGLTPAQIAGLFQRFRRTVSQGERRVDGVGLGLSFVQAVVERHGGQIRCSSAPGEGATFAVTLPLAPLA